MNKVNAHIFESISGEISNIPQGHTCTFLRFQNCNLQGTKDVCPYCDTLNSKFPAKSVGNILEHAWRSYEKTGALCITGGEPLLYVDTIKILLSGIGVYNRSTIFIETNGTIDFRPLINECTLIVDYKFHLLPESITLSWYLQLNNNDFVKFIVGNIEELATAIIAHQNLVSHHCKANFLYSVKVPNKCNNLQTLQAMQAGSKLILNALHEHKLQGSINVQMHKLLNFE